MQVQTPWWGRNPKSCNYSRHLYLNSGLSHYILIDDADAGILIWPQRNNLVVPTEGPVSIRMDFWSIERKVRSSVGGLTILLQGRCTNPRGTRDEDKHLPN